MEALITLLALQGRSLRRDPEIGDRGVGALAGAIMKESEVKNLFAVLVWPFTKELCVNSVLSPFEDPRSRLCLHFEGLGSLVRLVRIKRGQLLAIRFLVRDLVHFM
ncbi:hypothetical protein OIU79_018165 [Salix purpurea]|uniref:Uncharacterized protein n=1 Tax=Salix purpurea TaxID=77065 RepID=A0A9Q1AL03_SALPP|nr:hypothetical protein OIU79_018165 [Salix purpurea]